MRLAHSPAAVACVVLFALSGCGDDEESGGGGGGAETAVTTQPGSVGGVGATKPGETLAYGETASVKWNNLGREDTFDVDVTILKAEEAPASDFKEVNLDEEQKKGTAYYVTARIANTGKTIPRTESSGEPGLGIGAADDKGQELGNVTFIGDFPPCEYEDPPKRLRKGADYETCLVFLVPEGGTLAEVRWTGADNYVVKPVVWK